MNHFLKLAYNHGAQQALAYLGLSKLGSLGIADITRKIKTAPVDLSFTLKRFLRASPGKGDLSVFAKLPARYTDLATPMNYLERAAVGGLVGGAAGGLASDEDNTLRGVALGAALGGLGGGLSSFTSKKIYDGGNKKLITNTVDPYTITDLERLDDFRKLRALKANGGYGIDAPAEDVLWFNTKSKEKADALPLNRMLSSAALTGAGTIGAGILGGRMATPDSFSDRLKDSLGL